LRRTGVQSLDALLPPFHTDPNLDRHSLFTISTLAFYTFIALAVLPVYKFPSFCTIASPDEEC
jgi:hypothetical protein